MSIAGDVLSGLVKGAATGSVVPGIGTAVGGALGVAQALLPGVAHWLGADDATISKVEKTVAAVTGATTTEGQVEAIADPKVNADLRKELAQIAADREAAVLADVADARAQTLQLVQAGSKMSWGAPVVSVIVLTTFGLLAGLLLFRAVPEASAGLLQVLLGSLGTMAASVVGYWVGSSAGSARKTELMAQQTPVPPSPGVVVPAGDVQPAK